MNQLIDYVSRHVGPKGAAALTALIALYGKISSEYESVTGTALDEFIRGAGPSEWMPVVVVYAMTYLFRRARGDAEPVLHHEPEERKPTIDHTWPIGIRQNNPLNIRPTGEGRSRWKGEIDSGNGYARFESAHYGLRAAAYLLRKSYFKRYGLTTVRSIIERWAPYGDNSAESVRNYISFCSEYLSVLPTDSLEIDVNDRQLARLIVAMCKFENAGRMPYTPREINTAIQDI